MSDLVSPLGADYKPGQYGNLHNGVGVILSEPSYGFLGEIIAFADGLTTVEKLVTTVPKTEAGTAFKIAANRWFVTGPATLGDTVRTKLKPSDGSLVDLTHGRTCLRISGAKAEWVLSKLYAVDFSLTAFPVGSGLSTAHHTIFTQIHRRDEQAFELFIFRSLARSFWHTLQRAAEETGYGVI